MHCTTHTVLKKLIMDRVVLPQKINLDCILIYAINVNSIVSLQKRASLLQFLQTHRPDIVLLGETKLTAKNKLEFEHYNIIRNDRVNSEGGGGTAILLKKEFSFKEIRHGEISLFKCFEVTTIRLSLPDENQLLISAVYAAKGGEFNVELQRFFEIMRLGNNDNYYIMAGDFNAKHASWSNIVQNTRGVFLQNWINENAIDFKCTLYGTAESSFPSHGSFLDICIADVRLTLQNPRNGSNSLDTCAFDSDHCAVRMKFSYTEDSPFELLRKTEIPCQNFAKTDWIRFDRSLMSLYQENIITGEIVSIPNDKNLSRLEIDSHLNAFTQLIRATIDKVVPKIDNRDNISCYITPIIKALKREKSNFLSQLLSLYRSGRHRDSPEVRTLKSLIKNVNILIKSQFRSSVDKFWSSKIRNISKHDGKQMFPKINRIFRKKEKASVSNLMIDDTSENRNLIIDNGILLTDVGKNDGGSFIVTEEIHKLGILGKKFEEVHARNGDLGKRRHTELVNERVRLFDNERQTDAINNNSYTRFSAVKRANELTVEQSENYFTTFEDLRDVFRKLNNKKSSGLDGIPNIVLKHLPSYFISQYCTIFNNALNLFYFPNQWKTAKVIPLAKKDKDSSDPASYRPISLMPNISKVFEVVVKRSLTRFCDANDIIPNCQFGFRYKHSTVHAITKFTSDICWHRNSKRFVGACLIDLEKAFDTVWREGLIYKLLQKTFPSHLVKMIADMITGKKFILAIGTTVCDRNFSVSNGLQQGTVLSPLLFSIFICDLLKSFGFNDNGRYILAFADDLIIYTAHTKVLTIQEDLQAMYDDVISYLHTWKLKANPMKCETILFRPPLSKGSRDLKRNWKIFHLKDGVNQDQILPRKPLVRYLGVYIDEYLYFNEHLKIQIKKAKSAFMLVRRLFFSKHLSTDVKLICYKSLIRPILTYGCPIWFNQCPSYMEKYRVIERKILRSCLNLYRKPETEFIHYISNAFLYNTANINRIDIHLLQLVRKHIAKAVEITENDYIGQLFFANDLYFEQTLRTGYIPTECFTYLDREGYIQDVNNIPIIYHAFRTATNKSISCKTAVTADNSELYRFNTNISERDKNLKIKNNTELYWWLQ